MVFLRKQFDMTLIQPAFTVKDLAPDLIFHAIIFSSKQ